MPQKVAFISGHGYITSEEFDEHYVFQIFNHALWGYSFVVGDFRGVDTLAQNYLRKILDKDLDFKVIVYHMFDKPRFNAGWPTLGGFKSDEERDTAMTLASSVDIAWVRPGKEDSGTARNIQRRLELNAKP